MANSYEIFIGDGQTPVKVPAWATEETVKNMAKYSEATARALTDLIRQTQADQKVVLENQKIFQSIDAEAKRNNREDKQAAQDQTKAITDSTKQQRRFSESANKHTEELKGYMSRVAKSLDATNLSGFASAALGGGALGSAAVFAATQLEAYANNISTLSKVGVGLGTTFVELSAQAAETGLYMSEYSELISQNGQAIRALGDSAQSGARQFSLLSGQTKEAARQFNQFGMTNQEFNEALLEEIELRRMSGATQQQITDNLTSSFNELMSNTMALSSITGQDYREALRARQEAANRPTMIAARLRAQNQGDEGLLRVMDALPGVMRGALGEEMGDRLSTAIASGISLDRDFRVSDPELAATLAQIPSVGAGLTDLQNFLAKNRANMSLEEITAYTTSEVARLFQDVSLSDEQLQMLETLAARGNESSEQILTALGQVQGISPDLETNQEAMAESRALQESTRILSLAADTQDAMVSVQASLVETLDRLVQEIGGISDLGLAMSDGLRKIGDSFGPGISALEGIENLFSDFNGIFGTFVDVLDKGITGIISVLGENAGVLAAMAAAWAGASVFFKMIGGLGMAGLARLMCCDGLPGGGRRGGGGGAGGDADRNNDRNRRGGGRGRMGRLVERLMNLGRSAGGLAAGAAGAASGALGAGASAAGGGMKSLFNVVKNVASKAIQVGRFIPGPVGAALGVGSIASMIVSRVRAQTEDSDWQDQNPFPESGTQQEQDEWHQVRQNYLDSIKESMPIPADAQLQMMRDAGFHTMFPELDPNQQREMRLNTPGTRGALDNMREAGQLDPETHRIISGRTNPGFNSELAREERELYETQNRLLQDINDSMNRLVRLTMENT